jgi:hypothetical protein
MGCFHLPRQGRQTDFVDEFAQRLHDSGLAVWYDSFSLKLRDSLRRKIDEGLANSRYGIIILSKHFFRQRMAAKRARRRSHHSLLLENLALRQQLVVLKRVIRAQGWIGSTGSSGCSFVDAGQVGDRLSSSSLPDVISTSRCDRSLHSILTYGLLPTEGQGAGVCPKNLVAFDF